ncbi:MAG: DUF2177 family protein [Alphaproteobacteria bacterium]|nr:DUF2177 family protein [Alphaproteobacteria bacterium]
MLTYLAAYAIALVLFVALDIIWLMTMGASLYRATLGDILLPTVKIAPAIVFYLMFPIGIIVFAVAPALRAGSPLPALLYGALFGLLAYATYDLTNHATLKNWTLKITAIDIVYGAVVVGAVSTLTFYVLHWFGRSAG